MPITDKELKDAWLSNLTATPDALVNKIVESHVRSSAHLRMEMAIWLNSKQDPWTDGVTLLEICKRLPAEATPSFRPIEFGPQGGWPRIRVILTSPDEFQIDAEYSRRDGERSYVDEVVEKLETSAAKIVHPPGRGMAEFKAVVSAVE